MNKQCTNSSCRNTFSTLIYGGICPFCGKEYPQLMKTGRSRKKKCPQQMKSLRKLKSPLQTRRPWRQIFMWIDGKRISFSMDEIERWRREGQRIKGRKAARRNLQRYGYEVSVNNAVLLYESLPSGQYRLNRWRSVLNPETGKRDLVPVYRNIEHRFNARVLRYCIDGNELLSSCKGDGDAYYGLMKDRVIIDHSDDCNYILLSNITRVELVDLSKHKNQIGSKCLRITDRSRRFDEREIELVGRSEKFTRFAQRLLKLV